jgi:uncharacterized protein (TIGR02996 family)
MRKANDDGAALLQAIIDNPEEDTPRLMYADWLDEQGGESNAARAEFIRIQVAEAAKPHKRDLTDIRRWTAREEKLLDTWGEAWQAELPRLTGVFWQTQHYERGFVYHIGVTSVRSLLKAAPEIFSRAPVTWLSLGTLTANSAKQLANSPVMARIRHLDKLGLETWGETSLASFANSPHLGNLRMLSLWQSDQSTESLRAFLANQSLTRLTHFTLNSCMSAGTSVVSAIINSLSAPVIEEITFQGCGIGPDVAPLWAELLNLPKLKRVYLTSNRINDAAVPALAGVKVKKSLAMGLAYNSITDRGAESLLKGEFLRARGVRLQLAGNRITKRMQTRLTEAFGNRVGF